MAGAARIVVDADVWSFKEFVSPVVETVAVTLLEEADAPVTPVSVSAVRLDPADRVLELLHDAVPPALTPLHDHPAELLAPASTGLVI